MRVGISTTTINPAGALVFDALDSGTNALSYSRRVVRVATLDGGSTILDSGYSDTDREISLDITNITAEDFSSLRSIFRSYSSVLLFLPDGAYKASPKSLNTSSSAGQATFYISGVATNV